MALLEYLDIYFRKLKRFDSHQSRKRLLITLLVVCVLIIYIGPFFFKLVWRRKPILRDYGELCMESTLAQIKEEEKAFEAHRWSRINPSFPESYRYMPYIGNGKLGLSIDDYSEKTLYISGKRGLDMPLPFQPLVEISLNNGFKPSSTAVRYVHGMVNRLTCYSYYYKPVSVKENIYAHRLITPLLVQEIDIDNPTDVPFSFKLHRVGWKGGAPLKDQKVPFTSTENMDYKQISGEIAYKDDNSKAIIFSIVAPEFPESFEVPRQSKRRLVLRTFVNYTIPIVKSQIARFSPEVKLTLRETAKKFSQISPISLYGYHEETWKNLWRSGFGISYSKAQDMLNGDAINATLYYILSQKSVFQHDKPITDLSTAEQEARNSNLIDKPDSCYNGIPTLHAKALWSSLDSIRDINRVVNHWLLTLEKQGCHNLIDSGAEGTLQAFILSLGGLKFTKHHLEFGAHPKDLHRNYYIRRLRYSPTTSLNITVALGEDNKASLWVSLDKNEGNKKFFACDGGCMDAPVKLTPTSTQFPVKLTDPHTAILYITSDYEHIQELKHTIHVKEIAEAPAHEHAIITMHRHGHQLGGLPAIFWLSIVFLIVIFHLFLAKLIYNEYCGGSPPSYHHHGYERVRYAV